MVLKILTAILIIMVPVGFVIMLTDTGKQFIWTTTLFLGLQSFMIFIILYKVSGLFPALISASLIIIGSFVIEYIGVVWGFPFGNYSYTILLQPLILNVPVSISFAWFSVSSSSFLIVTDIFKSAGIFSASFIAAVLILALDMLLEPFASFTNGFWLWEGNLIPFQNFISWFVIGFFFALILGYFLKTDKFRSLNPFLKKIPYIIVAVNIINFLVLNFYNGYLLLSAVGISIILILILVLPRLDKHEA